MNSPLRLRALLLGTFVAVGPLVSGCTAPVGSSGYDITDVRHTDVERQSIGNCWLYAHASWIESMSLAATGKAFDASQSYWTYWDWFNKITSGEVDTEVDTGGDFEWANDIVLQRGLMPEQKFVAADAAGEASAVQESALEALQQELKSGRLQDPAKRHDRGYVRSVLDDVWKLSPSVKGQLTKVFGKNYERSFYGKSTSTSGTAVIHPKDFAVAYTERTGSKKTLTQRLTSLDIAIQKWREVPYPTGGASAQRSFQIRVQRALHDRQPVILTWDVDFNAMEESDPALRGSFNLKTLKKAGGPGSQGGHMTVLEDYQVMTKDHGLLAAGVTLDPVKDAGKLAAALQPKSTIQFLRIKNSWGALGEAASSAPGFPGYHDLYLDYLNGPIAWCPDVEGKKDAKNCSGTTTPWSSVVLPPGY